MIDPAFFTLQGNKARRVLAVFRRRDWPKLLVMAVYLAIFLFLACGIFFFSLNTFRFLGHWPDVSQPVIIYSLAVTFILASVLALVSSIITSLGALFQKEDNSLVFSLPIKTETIFESRLLDIIFLNSWPIFVFALPLTLGYSVALRLDLLTTFLFLTGILFLALSSTLLGAIVSLIASRAWGNLKSKFLLGFLLIAAPVLGIGLIRVLLPSAILTNLEALSIGEISQLVSHQTLMNRFLPTTWLVNLVYFWQKNPTLSAQNLIYLTGLYLTIIVLLLLLRGKFYLQAVNKTAEGGFIAAPWDVVEKRPHPFPYLLRGRMGALTEKDWLVIFRSSPQLFQLGFILFLEIVYLLVISRVPLKRFEQVFPDWHPGKLTTINFFFINYLVSVFAIRYLFPMISLEGQSSWVVWSAPIKRTKIFWQKFISSFLIIFIWTEISTFLSIKTLALSFSQQWPLFLVNLPSALALTFITLGIGAIKPNFWERNPEKLSTSPGGIIATAICLAYIGIIAFLLFVQKGSLFLLPTHLAIWLGSALVIAPILAEVYRKINQYEI